MRAGNVVPVLLDFLVH